MTWSYDGTRLEDTLNWIRFRVGDTDTNDQLLTDEEITSLFSLSDTKIEAAMRAANAISAKYARYGAQDEAEVFRTLARHIAQELEVPYL